MPRAVSRANIFLFLTVLMVLPSLLGCRAGDEHSEPQGYRGSEREGSAAQSRAKVAADALRQAGLCRLEPKTIPTSQSPSIDDVMAHFLCIANQESTLGKDLDGQGGTGLFGIKASLHKGRSSGGFSCRSDVRNSPVDNARCALMLYHESGFVPWGPGGYVRNQVNFGSNKHCSREADLRPWRKPELSCSAGSCANGSAAIESEEKLVIRKGSDCKGTKVYIRLSDARANIISGKHHQLNFDGAESLSFYSFSQLLTNCNHAHYTHAQVEFRMNDALYKTIRAPLGETIRSVLKRGCGG